MRCSSACSIFCLLIICTATIVTISLWHSVWISVKDYIYGYTGVGEILLGIFSSEEAKQTDLTEADELVRGLTFDKYHENVSCKTLEEIEEKNFEKVVNRIASRYQLSSNIKESILDGLDGKVNKEATCEFIFHKGTPGKVQYGITATIKRRGGTIDLSFCFYYLDFKLSPKRIKETKWQYFLGFIPYGSETIIHTEERNLAEKEKLDVMAFYRAKALKAFRKDSSALESSNRDEL